VLPDCRLRKRADPWKRNGGRTAVREPGSPHQPGETSLRDSVLRNWALAASSMRSRVLAVSAFDFRMDRFSSLENYLA